MFAFEPAIAIGFTFEELKNLWVLRGRASHAESKAGIEEHKFISKQISKVLPRLKSLIEQVLVTKKSWGASSLDVDRIAEVSGFVDRDGNLVIIKGT